MTESRQAHPEREDGSSERGAQQRATTDDGRLQASDVERAPLEQGTDPLGDQSLRGATPRRRTAQAVVFVVLGVLFAVFLVSDLASQHYGRAVFGAVLVAVCAYAAAVEWRRPTE